MDANRRRKIIESIAECDRYIAREEARSADLRPPEIAQRLEWYKTHREKLIRMLEELAQDFAHVGEGI